MENSRIDKVEWIGMLTGPDSLNADICKRANVGGTDLGFPVYVDSCKKTFLFFGDTFLEKMKGLWRSNVCAYASTEKVNGLFRFDGFLADEGSESAKVIVDSPHVVCDERTKIPTGGICVDGVIYMFFFSKYAWVANGVPRDKSMNFGGAVKSSDFGKTWERVHDLTWFDHGKTPDDPMHGNKIERLKELAMQETNLKNSGKDIDFDAHVGYYFTQIYPVDGRDGYIYIFGEGGYRSSGIKLGRVKKDISHIENFEEYSYFNGFDESGKPVWLKGSKGLKTVCGNDGAFVVGGACGEHTCVYNEYLKKWMLVYTRPKDQIAYTVADSIWGKYEEPQKLIDSTYPFPNKDISIYGGFTHQNWTEENGKVFYFIMSQYDIAYNSSMVKVTLK